MWVREKSQRRRSLMRNAVRDGATDSLAVFNHIIKVIDEAEVISLWGSYHQLSEYLDGVELEELR